MKNIKDFFLFKSDITDLTKPKRAVYDIVNILLLMLAPIFTGLCSLLLAYGVYPNGIFLSYFNHPFILMMNLLIPLLLCLFLYGLTGRIWLANLINGVVILGFTTANYYLIKFRDDPLMFSDIMYAREAAQINADNSYDMTPGSRILLCWTALILMCALLFFVAKKTVAPKIRIPAALIMAVLLFLPLKNLYFDVDTYNNRARNIDSINQWSSTQVYISKGFVYPFIHSISDAFISVPQGYTDQKAQKLLAEYEDSDIPSQKKVHIIGIMLEAFSDFSDMGIQGIDKGVYGEYHDILSQSYHGKLVTNIFAGGTIDTERAFLTGYSTLYNYRKPTNSYVHYLSSLGYYCEGSHPSYKWFYNRNNVNSYLGFEKYYFYEDYYSDLANGGIAEDYLMFTQIRELFEENKSENNYFGFHVTYQGHGPYANDNENYFVTEYVNQNGVSPYENLSVSKESSTIFNNYLGSVWNTTQNLVILTDYLKSLNEPVVLVFFGDHKPWLGDGNSVYGELGVNLDLSLQEGFMNYYCTDYAFWANDKAKSVLGNDFLGEGPTISPCFLMNELFSQCGYEGNAYMKLTDNIRKTLPVINNQGYIDGDGVFIKYEDALDESHKKVLEKFRYAQRYMSDNFEE